MPRRPGGRRPPTSGELGAGYGIVGGAAVGSLLLALTGDVLWVSIGPALGMLVGLAVAGLRDHRSD